MIEFDFNPGTRQAVQIQIAGIGGAGTNILDRLVLDGIENVELVALNTDLQSLTSSVAARKVQLGRETTRGLGAGGDPELGCVAAEEASSEIAKTFEGAGMVFLCVGLGGGTGSGATPLIAQMAREQGALVIIFATLPFPFEGKRRRQQAEESLQVLQDHADVVLCFENERMGDSVPPKAGIHQAFASADQTVSESVRAICNLFNRPGLIRIGFDELCTVLRSQGASCLFGHGEAEGDNRAHDCLARALKNPLMDRGRMLADAQSVLVNVAGSANMTLNEVNVLMTELNRFVSDQTHVFFGTAIDPKMGNRMSVTLVSAIGGVQSHAKRTPAQKTPQQASPQVPAPVAPTPEPEPIPQPAAAAAPADDAVEPEPELPSFPPTELPQAAQTAQASEPFAETAPLFSDSLSSLPFPSEDCGGRPVGGRGETQTQWSSSPGEEAQEPEELKEAEEVDSFPMELLSPQESQEEEQPGLTAAENTETPAEVAQEQEPQPDPSGQQPASPFRRSTRFGPSPSIRPRQPLPASGELGLNLPPNPQSQLPKTPEIKQETLQFEPVTRGRFEKSEPTIVDGQDLDVPTFLRRNMRIK